MTDSLNRTRTVVSYIFGEATVAICDDNTVWHLTLGGWVEELPNPPIPQCKSKYDEVKND
jgi:hypothetical protein